MGRAKEWAMEQEAQGFYSNNTRVCEQCVEDYALRDYIKKEGETNYQCSYCDIGRRGKKTVEFDNFVRRVLEGIETEWGDPNNEGVPWEHGWVGDVQDTYDLMVEELNIGFATEHLFNDVQSSLSDHQWCQKDFYELEPHQALSIGWQEFAKVVKHESRYVFFRSEDTRAEWRGREEIPPSDFLDTLGSVISHCRLYRTLTAGAIVCRLRVHALGEKHTKACELGPPPPEVARFANRMSAAGITAFYGAFDKDTAIAETTSLEKEAKGATLGHFKLLKDLHVVDFTALPPIPSVFEAGSRSRRNGILFLRGFLDDFTAPIQKDGREHIEYVPTQVVAEYLRFVHRGHKKRRIDGILYRSARHTGANACVIFIGPEAVCDPDDVDDTKILMLESIETFELQPDQS